MLRSPKHLPTAKALTFSRVLHIIEHVSVVTAQPISGEYSSRNASSWTPLEIEPASRQDMHLYPIPKHHKAKAQIRYRYMLGPVILQVMSYQSH